MGNVSDFSNLIAQRIKEGQEVQTAWVTVKEVNWDEKTMTCTGVIDELDYHDTLLGLGSEVKKPVVGSTALIGIISNNAGSTFLISSEEIEEIEYKAGEAVLNIKQEGFTITSGSESLKQCLNDMIDELNKIIVIQGTTINVAAMNAIKERLNTVLIE